VSPGVCNHLATCKTKHQVSGGAPASGLFVKQISHEGRDFLPAFHVRIIMKKFIGNDMLGFPRGMLAPLIDVAVHWFTFVNHGRFSTELVGIFTRNCGKREPLSCSMEILFSIVICRFYDVLQ
jgi:hypothetical protein